jgi:hypothetical protein
VDVCKDCDPGTYSVDLGGDSMDDCRRCPAGYYQDEGRSTFCLRCPVGFTNPSERQTRCSECEVVRIFSDPFDNIDTFDDTSLISSFNIFFFLFFFLSSINLYI